MAKDRKLKTNGKAVHPSSRKAKQISKLECHAGRVVKKRQNTKARFNNVRDRILWFRDQLKDGQTHVTKQELHELIELYLQRFQDELDQIEIKNHIGQRQKTPQHASRKALIESTIGAERHEYETSGIEVPNLCQTDVVRELREWDTSIRFMQRLKLCTVKQHGAAATTTATAKPEQEEKSTVSSDDEDESMENDDA